MIEPMQKVLETYEKKVFPFVSSDVLFNQFSSMDREFDTKDADTVRRKNLTSYLQSFEKKPEIVLVGEAAGYNGARFSGIPFTSEYQFVNDMLPFEGERSSIESHDPHRELSATIFWNALKSFHEKFIVINGIPVHPHNIYNKMSNRTPTLKEIKMFSPFVSRIIEVIDPIKVIAIGQKPVQSIERGSCKKDHVAVRHPSHGGSVDFSAAMQDIFFGKKGKMAKLF